MKTFFTIALFPMQVGKSFCYFNFKMAFRFLHRKNRNAAKRFGKKGWSLSCYVKRKQFVVKKWLILKNVILCNKGDNVVAYISQTVIH